MTDLRDIRVHLDPCYEAFQIRDKVELTIRQLLFLLGGRASFDSTREDSDLSYGPRPSAPAWFGASPAAWNSIESSVPKVSQGLTVPSQAVEIDHVDWVLASYYFLAGLYEIGPDFRELVGDRVPGSQIAQWGLDEQPLVEFYANKLKGALPAGTAPRWPPGKAWALVLSHDCDIPFQYDFRLYGRRGLHALLHADWRTFATDLAKLIYISLSALVRRDPKRESLLRIARIEYEAGVRGTYYWSTRQKDPTDPEDREVPYNVEDPAIRELVQTIRSLGHEIGLHNSIASPQSEQHLQEDIGRFRQYLGGDLVGMRGHYWSLGEEPEKTLEWAQKAGLRYDASYGMNIIWGYRRGVCYPFPSLAGDGQLHSLPTILMDGAFKPLATRRDRLDRLLRTAEQVKSSGGCLVIDWHSEALMLSWGNGVGSTLFDIIDLGMNDSSCWVCTAAECVRWCAEERWNPSETLDKH